MLNRISLLAALAAGAIQAQQPMPNNGPITPALDQDLIHAQGTNAGIFSFTGHCAYCHDAKKDGAPDRYSLNQFAPEQILDKMTSGSMAKYADELTPLQKRVIAVYVAGRPFGSADTGDASKMPNRCASKTAITDSDAGWSSWGNDPGNSRFNRTPGLTAAQVPNLKLKWAFGFPNGNSAYSEPTIVGGKVFVAADTGFVYSLNADTGCVNWSFRANSGVRTAVIIGPGHIAYFGDIKANVYAINADTGTKLWMQRAELHPVARITGSPSLVNGRLYVPVTSLEESGGGNKNYPCCTFRGSVVVYDANTGRQIWKSYTIQEEPKPMKTTSTGISIWGPGGAGVWSTPAVDLKRKAVYVATGSGHTEPAAAASDAVVAFDLETGKELWIKQLTSEDSYVRECPGIYRPNVPTKDKSETCPEHLGPDNDFGNSPILAAVPGGKTLIFVGQKIGKAYALDPDKKGELVWQNMLGAGFENGGGGMMWGSATDDKLGYFPNTRGGAKFGLAAVDLKSGEVAWRGDPPASAAAPAAVIPGVVFIGGTTGTVYAYSTETGKSIWQFDTAKSFPTVNGVEAKGGNFASAGPVIANGMVVVASGYSDLFGGKIPRGNVLLMFKPE